MKHRYRNIKYSPLFKVRYVQVVLLFFLMTIAFSIRMTLSVAIVAMTHNGTSSNPDVPTYEWKNTNIILSSFFWSYAITQFFAGHMAQVYGPKWLLATAMLANALASIAIPSFVNYFGANGVITCRIFQGLFQGFMLPLTHNMLGRWAPSHENSWINATVYTGCSVGGIIAMLFTGYLSASPLGWPSAFYFFGTLGLIWCLFWTCLSADSPATHKTITTEERKYIEISLGQENDHMMEEKSIPWKAIFTSVPYWAIIIAAVGESWGSTLLGTELPTYLSSVVGLDIEESSWYSAAPTIGSIIFGLLFGPLADYVIKNQYASRVNARRIFHGIGCFVPALMMVCLSYVEDKYAIVTLLITAVSATAALNCGHWVNLIDISPRYSGILAGIANGAGQFVAILAPLLVHFIVNDEANRALWRTIFILAAFIYASTATFFIAFASAERQWWDNQRRQVKNQKEGANTNGYYNQSFERDNC
ncbi:putative inorganic phosphate cotransporter isoform X2 [Cylas formicarius]|uniref:putative inorganic phosphate cotransporter isoform X2 n=1 Tax=Cylas formicarius TaxID=197179 RepID=UPI0029584CBB|nr:putative inorganic phosphate cotransporter isoform X2 [Cylas formicarius]